MGWRARAGAQRPAAATAKSERAELTRRRASRLNPGDSPIDDGRGAIALRPSFIRRDVRGELPNATGAE
jgi:hypothetical protein